MVGGGWWVVVTLKVGRLERAISGAEFDLSTKVVERQS